LLHFKVLCEAAAQCRRASFILASTGPVIPGHRGDQMVTNPASRDLARYANILRAYGAEFGMTPA
jgi:hypothetical protein